MKESKIKLVSFKGFCELMEQPMCAKGRTHIREDYAVTLGVPNLFRSMLDDAPFARADCMRMGIAKEGFCNLVINGVSRRCLPGDLIYINWGGVLSSDVSGAGIVFKGMAARKDYLQTIFGYDMPLLFRDPNRCFVLRLSASERRMVEHYLHNLYLLAEQPEVDVPSAQLMLSLLRYVEVIYRRHRPEACEAAADDDSQRLLDRFLKLVDQHVAREHKLAFYASELCISPTYLNVRIMQVSGETPKAWIDQALTLKAKIALRCSSAPIKSIVSELCFPSASTFVKFFKRMTGTTPAEYRHGKEGIGGEPPQVAPPCPVQEAVAAAAAQEAASAGGVRPSAEQPTAATP